MVAAMRWSDLLDLIKKDLLLLWRDRSFILVLLLFISPIFGLLRPPDLPSASPSSSSQGTTSDTRKSRAKTHSDSFSMYDVNESTADIPHPLTHVNVGVVEGGKIPFRDAAYTFSSMPRVEAVRALKSGHIDVFLDTVPDSSIFRISQNIPTVYVVYERDRERSNVGSQMLQRELVKMQRAERRARLQAITTSSSGWLLADFSFESLEKSGRETRSASSKMWGLGGSLVLAGALVSSLVMLIIVEENARHTFPLVLVCAVDRRTVFASKLLFCLLPTIGSVLVMLVRMWRALPTKPPDFLSSAALLGTAAGAGLLFVFIMSVLLVSSGSRARNNIDALAKVGGPLVLIGFLVALTFTPLSRYTPGLFFFPLTNLVLSIGQLVSSTPNWFYCLLALVTSSLFAVLLAANGALSMRTEQGLSGDVAISDPKLDALFLFMVAASFLVLLTNFLAVPTIIVYPSVGSLAAIAVLAVVGAGVVRFSHSVLPVVSSAAVSSLREWWSIWFPRIPSRRLIFSCLCAVVLGFASSYCFSTLIPAFAPDTYRLESLTRASTTPGVLFSMAMLRTGVEELVLRGIFVPILSPHFSALAVILLMSSIGAAIHPLSDIWIRMAILSAVLTYLRLASGSTLPPLLLHLTHTACLWLIWNRAL
jgi:membrane protease YdiL (CAAX protease family)